ncbi:hypothetical protein Dimus_000010 [Dionaea muscipula]
MTSASNTETLTDAYRRNRMNARSGSGQCLLSVHYYCCENGCWEREHKIMPSSRSLHGGSLQADPYRMFITPTGSVYIACLFSFTEVVLFSSSSIYIVIFVFTCRNDYL